MPFINHIGFNEDMLGKLMIPDNTKFNSSLNEIDIAMKSILLSQARITDPRNTLREWEEDEDNPAVGDWLWDESRVFQVDELEIEEIFNTYLLRKNVNKSKSVDISYPLLAYHQEDIETAFWGTGNRYKQWYFDLPADEDAWEVGDEVYITQRTKYFGKRATIVKYDKYAEACILAIGGETLKNDKKEPILFPILELKATGDKLPNKYKAKSITGKYGVTVLFDNKDEAQYFRDHFILRCCDANIWFRFYSPTIKNNENQIFTVFGIPNINKYPVSKEKIHGKGFIYGVTFVVDIWTMLADKPLPQGIIEQIRMNLHVEGDGRVNRIVITPD